MVISGQNNVRGGGLSEYAEAPEQDFIEQAFHSLAEMTQTMMPHLATALLDVSSSTFSSIHIHTPFAISGGALIQPCRNALMHCYTQLTGIRIDELDVSVYEHVGQQEAPDSPEEILHLIEPIDYHETLYGLIGIFVRADQEFTEQHKKVLEQQAQVLAQAAYELASIRDTAWRDALTGVFNRRGLEAELYRCWMDSQRGRTPMALG